jgi:hypothetical protein
MPFLWRACALRRSVSKGARVCVRGTQVWEYMTARASGECELGSPRCERRVDRQRARDVALVDPQLRPQPRHRYALNHVHLSPKTRTLTAENMPLHPKTRTRISPKHVPVSPENMPLPRIHVPISPENTCPYLPKTRTLLGADARRPQSRHGGDRRGRGGLRLAALTYLRARPLERRAEEAGLAHHQRVVACAVLHSPLQSPPRGRTAPPAPRASVRPPRTARLWARAYRAHPPAAGATRPLG